jgi:rubrerythrin
MKKVFYNFLVIIAGIAIITSCGNKKPVDSTTKTIENLKAAIKGETTASAKYAAYAQKATEEGFAQIAVLFQATSKAEEIHAKNHMSVLTKLGGNMDAITPEFEVKTTKENLDDAIKGEKYEIATMYPEFLKAADEEKVTDATKSFNWAMDTEKKHADLYQKAIDALAANDLTKMVVEYFVCPTCGNTFETGIIDEKCGFCQTSKEKFISIK